MAAQVTLSDEALRRKILAALVRDVSTRHIDLDVEVVDSVATLTGRVDGWTGRMAIERVAHAVKGVRALVLVLDVRARTVRHGPDLQIALAAVRSLRWNGVVPAEDLLLDVEDGLVTLRGEVDCDFHRSIAEDTVRGVSGVRGVRDKLDLRPRGKISTVARLIQRSGQRP
jgi:osmotically-inducible protein OsmY